MSVTRAQQLCCALGLLALSACQGIVLNPHGEDPSVDSESPTTPGEGTGVTAPATDPGGTDGSPISDDPSEPEIEPGRNGGEVPTVPPTDEADPVFSQPDARAAELPQGADSGAETQLTDAEVRNESRQSHHDAGAVAE